MPGAARCGVSIPGAGVLLGVFRACFSFIHVLASHYFLFKYFVSGNSSSMFCTMHTERAVPAFMFRVSSLSPLPFFCVTHLVEKQIVFV